MAMFIYNARRRQLAGSPSEADVLQRTPSKCPALPSPMMGVWNTQIEPRSG